MALNKSVSKFGITFDQAYHRVNSMVISKNLCSISVDVFANNSSDEPIILKSFEMQYNQNGGEPLEQAYLYLKSLDEYSDAVDC